MVDSPSRRDILRRSALLCGSVTAVTGCLDSGPTPEERVEDHRDELARFEDVSTALSAGYRSSAIYVRTDEGVRGTPFVNPQVETMEPTKPQVVLYGLTETGQYVPFGLEWIVPAEERDDPPSLFGKEFSGPFEDQTGSRHYALSVWLFRNNPDGLFARHNPAIDPPPVVDAVEQTRSALRKFEVGAKAENAGYRNTERCISIDRGTYGVPFVRRDTDGTGGTALATPPIMFYRVTSTWQYLLMGAEWYVPAGDEGDLPTMFGQSFHEAHDGHSEKTPQPRHYGLHAWLFKANPRGMFAPFNPTVRC